VVFWVLTPYCLVRESTAEKVKVKFTPEQAMEAQRGSRDLAVLSP